MERLLYKQALKDALDGVPIEKIIKDVKQTYLEVGAIPGVQDEMNIEYWEILYFLDVKLRQEREKRNG